MQGNYQCKIKHVYRQKIKQLDMDIANEYMKK